MPRAEPKRSAYCSSRHLLRNLENAAELRRNPLTQCYFASDETKRRDRDAERVALERILGHVHRALARCAALPGARCARPDHGRMHAALLRCEVDRQPLAVVAAELNLSERQLRRERRAAHDAFAQAFAQDSGPPEPATTTSDLAVLRLTEAAELHEMGQSRLAEAVCARVAAAAPARERRIEALCLKAEISLDALRCDAAARELGEARAIFALHGHTLDAGAASAATERIAFLEWLLRWRIGVAVGIASPPPELATPASASRERDEPGRALLVRALAAYAEQRWEVGDAARGREAIARASAVAVTLGPGRAKERFALMYAEARIFGLRERNGADAVRFAELEQLARSQGHLRTMLSARGERISSTVRTMRGERIFDAVLGPFGEAERGTMAHALASAALLVVQCERDPRHIRAATELAQRLTPPRSATALLVRCMHTSHALLQRRYDEVRALAQAIRDDAELAGNARVHGAASRYLALAALAQRKPRIAQHYIVEALPLLAQYGTRVALSDASAVARKLKLA
jgi:hypothetical protein